MSYYRPHKHQTTFRKTNLPCHVESTSPRPITEVKWCPVKFISGILWAQVSLQQLPLSKLTCSTNRVGTYFLIMYWSNKQCVLTVDNLRCTKRFETELWTTSQQWNLFRCSKNIFQIFNLKNIGRTCWTLILDKAKSQQSFNKISFCSIKADIELNYEWLHSFPKNIPIRMPRKQQLKGLLTEVCGNISICIFFLVD